MLYEISGCNVTLKPIMSIEHYPFNEIETIEDYQFWLKAWKNSYKEATSEIRKRKDSVTEYARRYAFFNLNKLLSSAEMFDLKQCYDEECYALRRFRLRALELNLVLQNAKRYSKRFRTAKS